ncbi:arabinan endo-1,5-alpha-L-arabinosidase [uncultured Bacteroides sp.]|uniref:arabinan endo-1,5-alpha-L-arabinosidase n=1 Tax=uncultured Bacteroides sp. TaxID=162156 RepID=UPI0026326EA0|nr:arabinan endo-1,5-alpha-L-arabinosidase [uncultured Bacteroides sp.]
MKTLFVTASLLMGGIVGTMAQPAGRTERPKSLDISEVMAHDPVMAKQGDTYYLYATGMGISVMSSKDLRTWKFEKPVFEKAPQWAVDLIPGYNGHTWAPDIIFHNGLYHIFYSCSAFAKNTSAIGHATTPTLDPSDPAYKWTDHGKIIQSVPNRDMWNAIDPNIIIDEKGTPWMAFGSFWDGIKLVKLSDDMMQPAQPEEWYSLSRRERSFSLEDKDPGDGAVEAPFILKHDGYYYLFVSFDYCCRGMESTYNVVVGRSKDVTGPYVDKEGKPMHKGGGSLVLKGNDKYIAVGHNAAYHLDGKDYFLAHAYEIASDGAPKLIIREISWTADGWPEVKW